MQINREIYCTQKPSIFWIVINSFRVLIKFLLTGGGSFLILFCSQCRGSSYHHKSFINDLQKYDEIDAQYDIYAIRYRSCLKHSDFHWNRLFQLRDNVLSTKTPGCTFSLMGNHEICVYMRHCTMLDPFVFWTASLTNLVIWSQGVSDNYFSCL